MNLFLEPVVGKALSQTEIPREDLFIQTKFVSQPYHRPFIPPYPAYQGTDALEACLTSLARSLENLQTHYIDAFLINAPDLPLDSVLTLLEVLKRARHRGQIRYVGVCNIPTIEFLNHLNTNFPDVLQIVQNPLHSPFDPNYMIPTYCQRHKIQYNTFYTLTHSDRIVHHETIRSIADRRNLTSQQVFLQFCVQSDITPLVGARSQNNLKLSLPIANGEIEPLSTDDMTSIERLMVDQAAINSQRRELLLKRDEKKMRQEKGAEKAQINRELALQNALADWERLEQKIVVSARARRREVEERDRQLDLMLRRQLLDTSDLAGEEVEIPRRMMGRPIAEVNEDTENSPTKGSRGGERV